MAALQVIVLDTCVLLWLASDPSKLSKVAADLPSPYPSDPMDKIIGATALDAGCALITPDRLIRKSKAVPVIW